MKKIIVRLVLSAAMSLPAINLLSCFNTPDTSDFIVVEAEPVIVSEPTFTAPVSTIEPIEIKIIEPTYAYTTTRVNVRTEPDFSADIIETLPPAVKVEYIGTLENKWTGISVNNITYYIYSEYLTIEKPNIEISLVGLEPTQYQEGEDFIYSKKMEDWTLTAYCACEKCCGKWSKYKKTASGTIPKEGRTVACVSLDFGTVVNIYGKEYIVEDTGRLKDTQIDIYFESHQEALEFGRQKGTVYLISEPEEE